MRSRQVRERLGTSAIDISGDRVALGLIAVLAVFALSAFSAARAEAAASCDLGVKDKTWIGTTGSAWNTAANWSPSGVPGAADDVCISTPPNSGTVGISGTAATPASLETTVPISIASGGILTHRVRPSRPTCTARSPSTAALPSPARQP